MLCKGLGKHDLLHQKAFGISRAETPQIDHGVQKRPGHTQHAQLQRRQLALKRHIGEHHGLGVKPPPFRIGAVVGEDGARYRHAPLDHGRILQLVPRPCLVGGQCPGHRVVGEVVHLCRGLGVWIGQGQDKLAKFPRVADKTRRAHEGSRHLCRLRSRGKPHNGFAIRNAHQFFTAHDGFNLPQPLPIARQHRQRRELPAFEFRHDVAVVAGGPTAPGSNLLCQHLHFIAHFRKVKTGALDQLVGRNIHAYLLQGIGIHRRGQPCLFSGPGKHLLAQPVVIVFELPAQHGEIRFPACQPGFGKKIGQAFQKVVGAVQLLFESLHIRADKAGAGQFFLRTLPGQRGNGRKPGLQSGIALQSRQGPGLPVWLVSRVQQCAQAPIDNACRIYGVQQVLA